LKHETAKAKLFVIQGLEVWVPKAVIEKEVDNTITTLGTFVSDRIKGLLSATEYFAKMG
jgi:hypothetical protein